MSYDDKLSEGFTRKILLTYIMPCSSPWTNVKVHTTCATVNLVRPALCFAPKPLHHVYPVRTHVIISIPQNYGLPCSFAASRIHVDALRIFFRRDAVEPNLANRWC